MPSINKNRTLGLDEAKRLLSADEAKRHETSRATIDRWPGEYNLRLIAEAVSKRRQFVEFDTNQRFKIIYHENVKSVFIKPSDGAFVPCGWFGYDKLKAALVE